MLLTNDGGIMELFAVAGTARGATNNTAITRAGTAQRAVPTGFLTVQLRDLGLPLVAALE